MTGPASEAVSVAEWLAEHGDVMPSDADRAGVADWLALSGDALPETWLDLAARARPYYGPLRTDTRRRYLTPGIRQAIFERDGWTCRLCGGRAFPRDLAPCPHVIAVIDHIIPLHPSDPGVAPGSDTEANLQCAHALCNMRKRNRTGWRGPELVCAS